MSQFLGAALAVNLVAEDDRRAVGAQWIAQSDWRYIDLGFRSPWWPRGQALVGDPALDVSMFDSVAWDGYDLVGGSTSALAIIGVSRDQYGTPLGSCVIQLFLTDTDAFVQEVTSDANGNFTVLTPFTGTHYVVAYKATAPDVFGTTVNTLVGA